MTAEKRRGSKRPTRVAPPKRSDDDREPEVSQRARERPSRSERARPAEPEIVVETKDDAPPASTRTPREKPRARRANAAEPPAESPPSDRVSFSERPSARPAHRSHPMPLAVDDRPDAAPLPAPELASQEAGVVAPAVVEAVPAEATTPASSPPSPDASADATSLDDAAEPGSVLVTGICGKLGRLVARELHRVERVIGVDRRPFPDRPKDILFHELDLRRKKTRDIFRAGNVRAVVHLGILHDPRTSDRDRHMWNVVAFQKLLEYMAQYEVRKLVVLSSANVYGPQPENPQFLTEEAPLLGSQEFGAIRDLVELDMLAQSYFWRHPESETVILRPCHIIGSVRNAPSNYLRLSRPITILGFDPMIQIIHERDVVRAILMALRPGVRGIFNLRGPGELPLSRILKRLGRKPTALPGPVARMTVDRLWRMRLASFPSPELDHVRYICMVDDTRAREVLGFTPRYSIDETLAAVESDA